jgi:hypothetical protein
MTEAEIRHIHMHLHYAATCYQEKVTGLRRFMNLYDFEDPNLRVVINNLEARAIDARKLATRILEREDMS